MSDIVSRIWRFCERHPRLVMTLTVLAQTAHSLNNRALWFSDEVRYADAYRNLALKGDWLVLALNGQPYPDKPPLYFWFLWLIDKLTPANMPTVFFIGAALSGLLFVYSGYLLARTLRAGRSVSLGAALILLSSLFLCALFHYSRMDLFFCAFIIGSHACFFRAFEGDKPGQWPVWGFVLAAIATLIKGPLGFIFPLLTTILFLGWRGELKKIFCRPMLTGLIAMLALLAAWIGGVVAVMGGPDYLMNQVLGKHVLQRATNTFHHKEPLQYYFIALPLAWLPWTLALLGARFKRLLTADFWSIVLLDRDKAGAVAYCWIMAAAIFTLLSSLSGKVLIYILPMFPPLAIIIAEAFSGWETRRTARVFGAVAVLFAILGGALLVGGDLTPVSVPLKGAGIAGLVLIACAGILWMLKDRDYRAPLLFMPLAVTLWLLPVGTLVAPSLDNAMSPKRQALMLKEYAEDGYRPMAWRIYSGIFSYYSEQELYESNQWEDIEQELAKTPKAALIVRERHWKSLKDKPALLQVDRQVISGEPYLLMLKQFD
ncbi:ArnT family glycosyltransferase [Salidesulfovibrio brasiliensis]